MTSAAYDRFEPKADIFQSGLSSELSRNGSAEMDCSFSNRCFAASTSGLIEVPPKFFAKSLTHY